jgi:PAS domain S-box-containing protein
MAENDEKFRFLTNVIPQMVWVADPSGELEYFNTCWAEYTGYTYNEGMTTDTWLNIIHPADKEKARKKWVSCTKTGDKFDFEHRLQQKTGKYKFFIGKVHPMKDGGGIDEQKKLERRLHLNRERLEARVEERTHDLKKSNDDLEQFAYAASHDLKEPLRMIASYSELIMKRLPPDDAPLQEFAGFVREGVQRMNTLISDLLNYSRIGKTHIEFSAVSFSEIVQNVLDSLSKVIAETGTQVINNPLPVLNAVPTQIRQLFQNLIENAIKFRKPGQKPVITIDASQREKDWLFCINDNGIGIDPQFSDRIFVIFQRLHTRDKYEGTGIGLSIAKKVVELHNGKIWLQSEPGKGTTFYFTIGTQ